MLTSWQQVAAIMAAKSSIYQRVPSSPSLPPQGVAVARRTSFNISCKACFPSVAERAICVTCTQDAIVKIPHHYQQASKQTHKSILVVISLAVLVKAKPLKEAQATIFSEGKTVGKHPR